MVTPHVHPNLRDVGIRVRAFRRAGEDEQLAALAVLHRRAQSFASASTVAAIAVSASAVMSVAGMLLTLYLQDKQWLLASAQRFDALALANLAGNRSMKAADHATAIAGDLYSEAAVNVFLALVEPLAGVAVLLLAYWVGWVVWRSRRRALAEAWLAVYERTPVPPAAVRRRLRIWRQPSRRRR